MCNKCFKQSTEKQHVFSLSNIYNKIWTYSVWRHLSILLFVIRGEKKCSARNLFSGTLELGTPLGGRLASLLQKMLERVRKATQSHFIPDVSKHFLFPCLFTSWGLGEGVRPHHGRSQNSVSPWCPVSDGQILGIVSSLLFSQMDYGTSLLDLWFSDFPSHYWWGTKNEINKNQHHLCSVL